MDHGIVAAINGVDVLRVEVRMMQRHKGPCKAAFANTLTTLDGVHHFCLSWGKVTTRIIHCCYHIITHHVAFLIAFQYDVHRPCFCVQPPFFLGIK